MQVHSRPVSLVLKESKQQRCKFTLTPVHKYYKLFSVSTRTTKYRTTKTVTNTTKKKKIPVKKFKLCTAVLDNYADPDGSIDVQVLIYVICVIIQQNVNMGNYNIAESMT